ncbi:hypothetical protein ACN4EG_10950 [Alkalinema pantanalense CENA528]|uniref:hypothetical protein n=1 Tax=Alkalinema pantanalense TaxID=1620705 RepID=UPI003D6DF9E9
MPEPEVSEAKVSEVKVSEVKAPELITIRTGSKIEQFQQQRVRLLGQYKASRQKPNPMTTGVIGFKGDYITARIFLQDGTEVGINSPMMKQSLRSEKEFQQYNEKVVEVVGRLERLEDSSENSKSSLYIVLETISLSLEK